MRRMAESHQDPFCILNGNRFLIIRSRCEDYFIRCPKSEKCSKKAPLSVGLIQYLAPIIWRFNPYSQLGFEERFGLMADAEWNRRQDNKLRRRVRDARPDIPSANMEGMFPTTE